MREEQREMALEAAALTEASLHAVKLEPAMTAEVPSESPPLYLLLLSPVPPHLCQLSLRIS